LNPTSHSTDRQIHEVSGQRTIEVQFCGVNSVTEILDQIQRGDHQAAEQLLPLVYRELRQLAAARLAQEHSPRKHDATSLVHEAYLRLVDQGSQPEWHNRGHFFAAA